MPFASGRRTVVTDELVRCFADILYTGFTSGMEADLDRIESGERTWQKIVGSFHKTFASDLARLFRSVV